MGYNIHRTILCKERCLLKNPITLNIISILLALLTIALMFVPFWSFTDDEETITTSISEFIWRPSNDKALQKHIKSELEIKGDLNLNTPALTVAASLFFSVFSIISVLKSLKGTGGSAACMVLGFFNVWGFLRVPMLHMNAWWWIFPVIGAALIVLNVSGVIKQIRASHEKAVNAYV